MRIQEIHERYDNWKILGNTIQLLDKDKKVLERINIENLINLWFDAKDREE